MSLLFLFLVNQVQAVSNDVADARAVMGHVVLLLCREAPGPLKLQTQQILDQVAFLVISESQVHTAVVVVDHGIQISEAPVVIEAALKWVDSAPIGEVR